MLPAATESLDYRGFPVLLTPTHWTEDVETEYAGKLNVFDDLTGRRAIDDRPGIATVRKTRRGLLQGRAAIESALGVPLLPEEIRQVSFLRLVRLGERRRRNRPPHRRHGRSDARLEEPARRPMSYAARETSTNTGSPIELYEFRATWAANGITEKRMIVAHAGDAITLSAVPPGLAVGDTLALYPGCDRTLATCDTKFGNSANFGGFPFIPTKNPFGCSVDICWIFSPDLNHLDSAEFI